jgi:DNA-binding winged helix-turn-helix (wHTH) protein/Tol biopolymer transport system component
MELMPSYEPRMVRFGVFEVDLRAGELRRNGVKVKVQNQPFQILSMLLERPGEIITRDEMQARLWSAETFVDFDHGLNSAIRRLRDALGDSAEEPTFVETLGRRGYRFVFPVEKPRVEQPKRSEGYESEGLAEVVSISGPAPEEVSPVPVLELVSPAPVPPVQRPWKLKAALACGALVVLASLVPLSNENSYLSRTRLGESARHLLLIEHAATPTITQRRLTANPSDTPVANGVISPDGKYLAFTDGSGFYIRQLAGGETHAIPLPEGFEPRPESWFPDSVHLVVSVFHDLERKPPNLWEISILGGTPRRLAEEGSSARVSPDGSKIAFLKGPWDNQEIWLMEPDGNGARKILDAGDEWFGPVAWAPDAKRFAYIRGANSTIPDRFWKRIDVYDLAQGRSERVLSEVRLGDHIAWMKTGRLIYAVHEAEPNQGDINLWAIQLKADSGLPSGRPVRITNDRDAIAGLSADAAGNRLALLRSNSQADVYVADVEERGERLSAPRRLTLDQRDDYPTTWTPDSKTVLFLSDRDGPFRIFKQDIGQTQSELLVGGDDIVIMAPRLTPDGLSALYLVTAKRKDLPDNRRLMRVPLAGGASQVVVEGPEIMGYQCARLPSKLCIYGQIESNSDGYRFFTFDPAGGKGTELLAGKVKKRYAMNNWSLSPDGKYLVTAKGLTPTDDIALRIIKLADGTEQLIPVPQIKLLMGMEWSADSSSIWVGGFMGRGAGGARSGLLNVRLNGSVKVALRGLNPGVLWGVPSPDGQRLALLGNTESSNMWLLENF